MRKKKTKMDLFMDATREQFSEWGAMLRSREFWVIVAVAALIIGFLAAAASTLINFDMMRMRNCFDASNLNAFLMFNILMLFIFDGFFALGEIFNYFDDRKRGIPHKPRAMAWFIVITLALGTVGLVLVKVSCV